MSGKSEQYQTGVNDCSWMTHPNQKGAIGPKMGKYDAAINEIRALHEFQNRFVDIDYQIRKLQEFLKIKLAQRDHHMDCIIEFVKIHRFTVVISHAQYANEIEKEINDILDSLAKLYDKRR